MVHAEALDVRTSAVSKWFAQLREMSRRNATDTEMVRLTGETIAALQTRCEEAASHEDMYISSKNLLQVANLRLVIAIARGYRNKGIPLADLVQEGNCGLITAVEKYQHERGHRFATYAAIWIRQAIGKAFSSHGGLIRLSADAVQTHKTFASELESLTHGCGHRPSTEEIESATSVRESERAWLRSYVRAVQSIEPASADEESPNLDIRDRRQRVPTVLAHERDLFEALYGAIGRLEGRNREIVTRRFGLDGHRPHTLDQTAKVVSLSKERVRQLERDTLVILGQGLAARLGKDPV